MDEPITPRPAQATARLLAPQPSREPTTLYRDEVVEVVDAGLGTFLQHVQVDASLEHGHFHGFRILRLMPPEYWHGVDLKPGDVVTRINGNVIERPPQAHQVFSALKTAEQLVVSYERAGEPRQLVFRIAARPTRPNVPPAANAAKPAAATKAVSPPSSAPSSKPTLGSKPTP